MAVVAIDADRQASRGKLAQQILARRENLNSLPEGFQSDNQIASLIIK